MSLRALIHTPPPVHAFSLGEDTLLYGRANRSRSALERAVTVSLPPAWYRLGPVGVLSLEREALVTAVQGIVGRLDRVPRKASLVIPNTWVRSVVLGMGPMPSRREQAEEVLRWRLKKLLPCRPEEVRLDYLPTPASDQVLVALALDKPLSVLEEVFIGAGVELGRIEPAAWALAALMPANGCPQLLVTADSRSLGLVLSSGGRPVLTRHKALPGDEELAEPFVVRELGRTLEYVQQQGFNGGMSVWLVTGANRLASAVREWSEMQPQVQLRQLEQPVGDVQVSGLDRRHLWPLLGTIRPEVT